jgi:hypothetical protein
MVTIDQMVQNKQLKRRLTLSTTVLSITITEMSTVGTFYCGSKNTQSLQMG